MMDYPCDKFGDCSFKCFWFYGADKQTLRDAYERLTPVTLVDVSN